MRRRKFFQLVSLSLVSSACDSGSEARAQAEAEKARRTIVKELKVGSPEAEVVEFFKRHGWKFYFDDSDARFVGEVYRSREKSHVVTAYIYVNAKKELVRSDVRIDVTFI